MKRYIFEADISINVVQRHCIWCILNIRRNGHHFQESVITTVAILELLRKVYQLGNRLGKVIDIQKKSNKVCGA